MKLIPMPLIHYLKKQFGLFFAFFIVSLLTLSAARAILILLSLERVQEHGSLTFLFLQGIRFDVITTSIFLMLGYLFMLALSWNRRGWIVSQIVLRFYFTLCLLFMLFMELSTPSFIQQFDIRPNYLFVEYLGSPKEVLNTLMKAYTLQLLVAAILLPLVFFTTIKTFKRLHNTHSASLIVHFALAPVVILLLAFAIRSTLSHRPVNPSIVAKTSDPMVNSLALNSTYSLSYAIYSAKKHEQGDIAYGKMERSKIFSTIESAINVDSTEFTSTAIPTLHQSSPVTWKGERPKNLVILLQESLGAEFVGSLGGLPLTPNIDKFKTDGIWFDRMYATGTRSARGIEAVITGFPPSPARSVLKLPKSQMNFFSIAELLKRRNYETSFIYGGEAHFDNMSNFFVGNGFSKIIQQKDYENPKFIGSWGASDEDLFNKADEYFTTLDDKPFFSLVFSSSNHTPFEYPENTIEPYDSEVHTVNNAVKYADYAFGKFVEKARKSKYWDNTVFVLVADHNSRVYGSDLVPIERFHIPAFIFGGGITPQNVDRIASQIDLIPTLLPLMGIQAETPCIGLDLLSPSTQSLPGRAMFQFNALQAYMEEDDVIVLQNDIAPSQFRYEGGALIKSPQAANSALIDKALAHALWGPIAYHEHLYTLPSTQDESKHSQTILSLQDPPIKVKSLK